VTLVVLTICIFLSFYFAFLSFQTVDDALRKNFVIIAAASLFTGVVIFACMTIYLGIKRSFSYMGDQLNASKEQAD
jgi:hypothetical protein